MAHDFAHSPLSRRRPVVLLPPRASAVTLHAERHADQFLRDGYLSFRVDPDSLARSLPEREQYIRANSHTASKMLHPEAALLQEILSGVAKEQRRPLVIDGSLSDCGWFGKLMKSYREEGYACEILFVVSAR